jgi:hypothetical protein
MKALSRLMYRSFVVTSLALLSCANILSAQEKFAVTPSDQDLFGKVGEDYKVRVRLHGKETDPTEYTLKIKVRKITADVANSLTVADATGDVEIRDKTGNLITEIKVKNGQDYFKITPKTSAAGQNLVIQLYNDDANKPVGYMVLAVKPTTVDAEKEIKTVSTPIGVGRH